MSTVTLWTDVRTTNGKTLEQSGAQTTGSWSNVSKPPSATSNSDAPGTYNGTIDYTGEPDGTYIYRYTVGNATSDATITVTSTPDRSYTTCDTAHIIVQGIQTPPYNIIIEDDSREVCGEYKVSTDQELPLPSSWSLDSGLGYSGDLWYKITTGPKSAAYLIEFIVDGSTFGSDGIKGPAIDVYIYDNSQTCVDKVQQVHIASTPNSQIATVASQITANSTKVVVFRVSSISGSEGQFNITVQGVCPV